MKHHGRTNRCVFWPAAGFFPAALAVLALLTGCAGKPAVTADVVSTTPAPPASVLTVSSEPYQKLLVDGWEESLNRGLSLQGVEADSTLFFRYQTLLTHIDIEKIARDDAALRARAEGIRIQAAEGRDQAWQRWQVDITPPPELGIAEDPLSGLTIRPETNELVTQWIDYFTGTGRERFALWMWRSGAYRPAMEEILRQEGLPPEIIALVFIESGFSLTARSRARAVGPWQFIQGTAKRYGLTVNRYRDERRDFELATRSAAKYLSDLYGMFGDWKLALAAYNCGEGRVFRQVAKQNTTDYWALNLPRETRNYVPKFYAALMIISQPEVYGFSTESTPAVAYEEITLPGPVKVEELARHCGVDVEDVKSLNPAWLHPITPADGDPVKARVPMGTLARFSLADLTLVPLSQARNVGGTHRVKRGDTLGGIARRYGVSINALAHANNMSTKSVLRAGRTLHLPDGALFADASVSEGKSSRATKSAKSSKSSSGGSIHVVRSGETFWSISQKHGLRLADLLKWNGATKRSVLKPGMKVRLAG